MAASGAGKRHVTPAAAFAVATTGIAVFSCMDALMKGLSLAIGVYNALTWRMLAAAAMAAVAWFWAGARRPQRAVLRIHLVRGLVGATMAFLFFWGLARVPMAQAIALSYVAPLLALYLASVLLGEHIGRRTLLASLLAFAGVLLVMFAQWQAQLGHQAFLGALAILGSAVCYAWNIILMRQQSLLASAVEAAFFQSAIVAAAMLVAAPWLLEIPDARHLPAILLAAALATTSLFLLSWAYGHGEANYLAPTEYTSFVWASALGWLVFGERVSPYTVAGAALIVAACVLAARRASIADTEAQLP